MRALFLREDAGNGRGLIAVTAGGDLAAAGALIVAACEQPVMWDEDGPGVRHVVVLALHEIGARGDAADLGAGVQGSRRPGGTEARLADPADPRALDAFAEMAGARPGIAPSRGSSGARPG